MLFLVLSAALMSAQSTPLPNFKDTNLESMKPRTVTTVQQVVDEMAASEDKTIEVFGDKLNLKVAQAILNLYQQKQFRVRILTHAWNTPLYVDLARYGVLVVPVKSKLEGTVVFTKSSVILGGLVAESNDPTLIYNHPIVRANFGRLLDALNKL